MIILYLIILAVAIFIQYIVAKQFESVAYDKGYCDNKYFHFCFWLTWIGYLLVIALPDRNSSPKNLVDSPEVSSEQSDNAQQVAVEKFQWSPVAESIAYTVGETNIRCANCHRVQFYQNKKCTQCGATFVKIKTEI